MAFSFGANRGGGKQRDLTGVFVVLALLVMTGLVIFHPDQSGPQTVGLEAYPDPSVDNTRASGSRGLYAWVGELGYRSRVWRRDFSSLPSDAAALFCIAPDLRDPTQAPGGDPSGSGGGGDDDDADTPNDLTGQEGSAVRQWVSKGRTFILFASRLPTPQASAALTSTASGDDEPTFGSEIGLRVQSDLRNSNTGRRQFSPQQPSIWTDNVGSIEVHASGARLARGPNSVSEILFGDTVEVHHMHKRPASASYLAQPVAVVYPIGRGHVIAVADDEFGCNANLCRAGNAQFIADVLRAVAHPGSTVLFDEYHRGSGGPPSPSIWSALGRPLQYGLLQLALAGIVALLVLAPRLGRPLPLNRSAGHTTAEYVASLAGLYQSAHATNTALETIYRQFLREICARYALPTDATVERLADVAARRGEANGDDLRRLLIACEQGLDRGSNRRRGGGVTDQELITLVRAIERFRKELGIA